jgi:lysophospholipase L1-like esterase
MALAALLFGAFAPASSPPPHPAYVALGDSYTAGPLVPQQSGEPAGCMRSGHDYPHLLAAALHVALADVSCSGAGTEDLTFPQRLDDGQTNRPQLDALAPDTRLVTLGIGGNDIGFIELVQACIAPLPLGSPCHDRYVGPSGDRISQRIAATAPRVAAVLAEVHRRAPSARVYVIGYPAILPDAGPGCWPVMPYAIADVSWLRAKEKELNAMLAAQAGAGGATYVDTYGPSVDHHACSLPWDRWVEPLLPLSPAAPVHPNARGMQGMADVAVAAIGTAR